MLRQATGNIRCYACIQAAVRAFQNIDGPGQRTFPVANALLFLFETDYIDIKL